MKTVMLTSPCSFPSTPLLLPSFSSSSPSPSSLTPSQHRHWRRRCACQGQRLCPVSHRPPSTSPLPKLIFLLGLTWLQWIRLVHEQWQDILQLEEMTAFRKILPTSYRYEYGNLHNQSGLGMMKTTLLTTDNSWVQLVHDNNLSETASKYKLRWDWTRLQPLSTLARQMAQHQKNCSLPLANFRFRNRFGMGSDLHVWSQALCNAMEPQQQEQQSLVRVRTDPDWVWLDQEACIQQHQQQQSNHLNSFSAMTCYFGNVEMQCPTDESTVQYHAAELRNLSRGRGRVRNDCPQLTAQYGIATIRAAATEFLFTTVSPAVQQEAERQWNALFPPTPDVTEADSDAAIASPPLPHELVTVHMRWGDKADEMKLVSAEKYVRAVQSIFDQIDRRNVSNDTTATARPSELRRQRHVLLATEDVRAVRAFQTVAPAHWNVHVDQYLVEVLPYRRRNSTAMLSSSSSTASSPLLSSSHFDPYGGTYNINAHVSQAMNGRAGLVAAGSLLVAMQSNHFVLTTASNWSRLINELRRHVLELQCRHHHRDQKQQDIHHRDVDECATIMVDLQPGEW